jgi:hypothetical protein
MPKSRSMSIRRSGLDVRSATRSISPRPDAAQAGSLPHFRVGTCVRFDRALSLLGCVSGVRYDRRHDYQAKTRAPVAAVFRKA